MFKVGDSVEMVDHPTDPDSSKNRNKWRVVEIAETATRAKPKYHTQKFYKVQREDMDRPSAHYYDEASLRLRQQETFEDKLNKMLDDLANAVLALKNRTH